MYQNIPVSHVRLNVGGGIALCNNGPSHLTFQHGFIWMSHGHTHQPSLFTRFLSVSYSSGALPVQTAPASSLSPIHFALSQHRAKKTTLRSQKHELFFFRSSSQLERRPGWHVAHRATQASWLTYHVYWIRFRYYQHLQGIAWWTMLVSAEHYNGLFTFVQIQEMQQPLLHYIHIT